MGVFIQGKDRATVPTTQHIAARQQGGREGVTEEMMRRDGEHIEGMVPATPLSLAHRCTCATGGLFCQLVFASVGMKNTRGKSRMQRVRSR